MPMSDALKDAQRVVGAHAEFLAQVQDAVASRTSGSRTPPAGVPKALVRDTNKQIVKAFCRGLRSAVFRVEVPGQHYSGLSNQELLEVREGEGRDFAMHTVQLDQYLTKELTERYSGFDARVITAAELRELAGKLIVARVAARIYGGGIDVEVPALSPAYAAYKRKAGRGGRPVGVFSGRHVAAIAGKARVVWE
jgi:hypothetical protein